jgi:hypothetical protein
MRKSPPWGDVVEKVLVRWSRSGPRRNDHPESPPSKAVASHRRPETTIVVD